MSARSTAVLPSLSCFAFQASSKRRDRALFSRKSGHRIDSTPLLNVTPALTFDSFSTKAPSHAKALSAHYNSALSATESRQQPAACSGPDTREQPEETAELESRLQCRHQKALEPDLLRAAPSLGKVKLLLRHIRRPAPKSHAPEKEPWDAPASHTRVNSRKKKATSDETSKSRDDSEACHHQRQELSGVC